MKKIILSSVLLASSLLAADIKPFIGVNLGAALFPGFDSSTHEDGIGSGVSFGAKAGVVVYTNHRVYVEYGLAPIINYEDVTADTTLLLANYDYIFNFKVSPYIGVHFGKADYEFEYNPIFSSGGVKYDSSSTAYGFQGGIIYNVNEHFGIEAGAKYSVVDFEKKEARFDNPSGIYNLFFGLNLSF